MGDSKRQCVYCAPHNTFIVSRVTLLCRITLIFHHSHLSDPQTMTHAKQFSGSPLRTASTGSLSNLRVWSAVLDRNVNAASEDFEFCVPMVEGQVRRHPPRYPRRRTPNFRPSEYELVPKVRSKATTSKQTTD